jgi:DNA-binding GntR family transcriptional regulator
VADIDALEIKRDGSRTIAAGVAEAISERIVRGVYKPGERLVETELARDLGVGRGSIREALRRLESNHYIQFEPNRGAMVARPNVDEVTAMLRIRSVIAGLGARAAAERIDLPGHRERVQALLERIDQEMKDERPDLHRGDNGHFHRTLNEISGIHYVGELIDQVNIPMLYEIYFRELTPEQHRGNLDDHFDLARAVLMGDADAADHFAQRHMLRMIEIAKSIATRW